MKYQALIYLFKAWTTAAVVFPICYTFYYLYFIPNPDGMIWLWCMIAVPTACLLVFPCWLLSYAILWAVRNYRLSITFEKLLLCITGLFIIAFMYVCFFGFTNDVLYTIPFISPAYLVVILFIFVYRLKPHNVMLTDKQ
jgi:hypothetical protein